MPIGGAYPCVPVSSVASPKSESLTEPSSPMRTFSGLRSACTQPTRCRWASPSQIPVIIRPPSASVTPESSRSRRLPVARSMTSTTAPSRAGWSGAVRTVLSSSRTRRGCPARTPISTSRRAASATFRAWRGASPEVGMIFRATSAGSPRPAATRAARSSARRPA